MFHVSLATPTGPWRDQFARLQKAIEEPTDSDKGLVPLHVNLSAVDVGFGSGQDRRSRSPVKCFLKQRCAQQNGVALLVEVGVYLGQSVAEWLGSVQGQDCVHVVGIDPFTNPGNTTPPPPHKPWRRHPKQPPATKGAIPRLELYPFYYRESLEGGGGEWRGKK